METRAADGLCRGGARLRIAACVIGLAVLFPLAAARACDSGTVRDAALHARRDVHRLCYFMRAGDDGYGAVEKALEGAGPHLNIVPDKVDCGALIDWPMYGFAEPPAGTPFVGLVGPSPCTRQPVVFMQWPAAPDAAACAALRTSPLREAIKAAVIDYWAAIVYAPAGDDKSTAIHPEIQAVAAVWNAQRSPGLTVLRLDRRDPSERVFCAFAGIEPDGPAWAGIVYGRGKLMTSPLQGDGITRAALDAMLRRLPMACTCLQDAVSFGIDMPMAWEPEWDAKVLAAASTAPVYFEETLGPAMAAAAPPAPGALPERHVASTAIVALGAGFIITAVLTAAFVIRQRRKGINL